MRRWFLSLFVLAIGVSAGSAHAQLPAPVVSLSTKTTKSPDSVGVIVNYARACARTATTTTCPTQWRLAAVANTITFQHVRTTSPFDTLYLAKPICPAALTVKVSVIADYVTSTKPLLSSPISLTKSLTIRCRELRPSEIILADTTFEWTTKTGRFFTRTATLAVGDTLKGVCVIYYANGDHKAPTSPVSWTIPSNMRLVKTTTMSDTVWLVAK